MGLFENPDVVARITYYGGVLLVNFLSRFLSGDDERAAVAAAGGVAAAVHAMERFPTDSTVQVFLSRVHARIAVYPCFMIDKVGYSPRKR